MSSHVWSLGDHDDAEQAGLGVPGPGPAAHREVAVRAVLPAAGQTGGPEQGAAHTGALLAQPGGGLLRVSAQPVREIPENIQDIAAV